jgi:MoaA/NifB/PqqE/SkfB family radical SAM enzyme
MVKVAAADTPDILFPIFTNGTFIDEKYLELLDVSRT